MPTLLPSEMKEPEVVLSNQRHTTDKTSVTTVTTVSGTCGNEIENIVVDKAASAENQSHFFVNDETDAGIETPLNDSLVPAIDIECERETRTEILLNSSQENEVKHLQKETLDGDDKGADTAPTVAKEDEQIVPSALPTPAKMPSLNSTQIDTSKEAETAKEEEDESGFECVLERKIGSDKRPVVAPKAVVAEPKSRRKKLGFVANLSRKMSLKRN